MSLEREALEAMVFEFGYYDVKDGKAMVWTGGMAALELAFSALGWDDPHFLPEKDFTCEIVGCMQQDVAGLEWDGLYLRLCSQHSRECFYRKPRPSVKPYAVERESMRDPVTKRLP